jgi:transaldolase
MPEKTLLAFAEHGKASAVLPRDGGDCERVLAELGKASIDLVKLAASLQAEGAKSFDDSWRDLLKAIEAKSAALK